MVRAACGAAGRSVRNRNQAAAKIFTHDRPKRSQELAGAVVGAWRAKIDSARGRDINPALRSAIADLKALDYHVAAPGDTMEDWARDEEGVLMPPEPPIVAHLAAFAEAAATIESRAAAATSRHFADKAAASGFPPSAAQAAAEAA